MKKVLAIIFSILSCLCLFTGCKKGWHADEHKFLYERMNEISIEDDNYSLNGEWNMEGQINLNEIESYFDKVVDMIVYVDKIKEVNTSKGDKMCFISGSDEISTTDIVMFPKLYEKYKNIKEGDIILVKGKVEKRFDKYQIVLNDLKILE